MTDPDPIDQSSSSGHEALPAALARLAAMQGLAIPVHRFGMVRETEDGVAIEGLPLLRRASELWRIGFPEAVVREVAPDHMSPGDFPLLWVSHDDRRLQVVRGRLGGGAYLAESPGMPAVEVPAESLADGTFLALSAHAESQDGEAPRSATQWFRHAVGRHRAVFAEAGVATLMLSVIGLASSLYTMQVYDRVVPNRGFSTLWVLTVGVLLAVGFEFTVRQVRATMIDRISKVIDLELSAVFFGKALDIRLDARPRTVGTFASQIRHFESVRAFLTASTLFLLADAPFALFFVGVISFIAGPLALVPLLLVPVALATGLVFGASIERATAQHMDESDRKNGLLIEAIDGIESVKAAGGEWKMLEQHRRLTARIADSELQLRALSTRATNLTQSIQQLSYIGLIVAGAYAIASGRLSLGGLIACSIISGRALAPVAQLPQFLTQWKHAKIALKALDAIMAMPGEREPGERLVVPERCDGRVRMDDVAFHYRADRPAFSAASLNIGPGERVAVLGPVGSGKSTLIKLMSGLYMPHRGSVQLDGVDIRHLAPEFVREHIGYLPQEVRLFRGSLRENLTLGLPTPSDETILQAARATGLDQVIAAHPRGLELEISEGGRGLSGGQRQLVGLTRLLLARPRVLLLDEPTASMDGQLESRVAQSLFEGLAAESVVILVTHKVSLLPHVGRIIVVDRGRITMDGPRDEVLARLLPNARPAGSTGEAS